MTMIKGIYAATLSVLDSDLGLDIEKTITHAEAIIDKGCHGVVFFGSTGQSQLISLSEKINLINNLSSSSHKENYIIGTGLNSLSDTISLMKISMSLGFSRFLIMPPAYYKYDDEDVFNFYSKIIKVIPEAKIILYNFEKLSGYKFSENLVYKLVESFPNQITMVGYMRRYAGSFLKAKELMRVSPKKTEYLRFRDIICEGPFFVSQTRPIFSPVDIPSDLIEESKEKRNRQLDSALGPETTAELRTAYQMLTGLGCHSLSAVRELFGSPISVKAAAASHQGELLIIVLEYDGFLATYELVNNQEIVQFDATIEIYQRDRRLKINYETPYVRHQSSTLELSEYAEGNAQTNIYGPDYKDPFVNEICEFYDCIASSRKPKTSLQDSLEDLELFQNIIETLKASK